MHSPTHEHQEPKRVESAVFFVKSRILMAHRWWDERRQTVRKHPKLKGERDWPEIGKASVPLWTQVSPQEFSLTAGKVQNLRAAAVLFDGLEIPAGEIFSFWRQVGRTTVAKGFTTGRELRSGCLVPSMGGGLCQLSGLLHAVALEAGFEVVERHAHSRTLPGVPLADEHDATVFWNYVDLRFRAPYDWFLEVRLSATELVVVIRSNKSAPVKLPPPTPAANGYPARSAADGDCHSCGVTECFRHPSANRKHTPSSGHTAWLLEGFWPEFGDWCGRHARPGDRWMTPMDGRRWKKPNYAWTSPAGIRIEHATLETLRRAWFQRRISSQGAARQTFLLKAQRRLAENFARRLDPQARHIVVSQTLLPHLWRGGYLGGRTFDVLITRWPLSELQSRLDAAFAQHPQSETLADYRADPALVIAESQALAAAARIITPHRMIANFFGARGILLDWELPLTEAIPASSSAPARWFFPASPLGRKGIHEMVEALKDIAGELLVLGRAREGNEDPLREIACRQATIADLENCTALVLPAWIEHEPRLLLRALALGIPVIASRACGLAPHPLLTEIETGDSAALKRAMLGVLGGDGTARR